MSKSVGLEPNLCSILQNSVYSHLIYMVPALVYRKRLFFAEARLFGVVSNLFVSETMDEAAVVIPFQSMVDPLDCKLVGKNAAVVDCVGHLFRRSESRILNCCTEAYAGAP